MSIILSSKDDFLVPSSLRSNVKFYQFRPLFLVKPAKKQGSNKNRGLKTHCNGNSVYIFLFWELRGLRPNCHIHVSVSDLYIPTTGPLIFLQQNMLTDCGNI